MSLQSESNTIKSQNQKNANDMALLEGLGLDITDAQDIASISQKTMPMVLDLARSQAMAEHLSGFFRAQGYVQQSEALSNVAKAIQLIVDGVRYGDIVVLKMATPAWLKDHIRGNIRENAH